MSNKSGFEIRADLLKLAQEHLQAQYHANVDFATQAYQLMVEQGKAAQTSLIDYLPKPFTFEDMMEKAKEMYEFVAKKD